MQPILKYIGTIVIGALVAYPAGVGAQERQEMTLQFQAKVGEQPFACDRRYATLGSQGGEIAPMDFRLYISDIFLLDARGNAIPLALTQDGRWQYENVALLDFENKVGSCRNGTAATRNIVVGTVPAGDYRGLRFTLGVPSALNHGDATLAPSPLNLTSLWWNWQGGYKFLRLDLGLPPTAAAPLPKGQGDRHGHHGYQEGSRPHHGHHGSSRGYTVHIGSTGCTEAAGAQTTCRFPNRPTLAFEDFDVARDAIVLDIAALLSQANLANNAPGTPGGCLANPEDSDCTPILRSLGLGGVPQTFFRLEPLQLPAP